MEIAKVIQYRWYKWTCPLCDSNNEENGDCVNKLVRCDNCEYLSKVKIVNALFDEGC